MRATMAAAAALAGGLFLLATSHGPASATSVPIDLKNVIGTTPGSVELVRGDHRRYAERDHDHNNHGDRHRHRVFRNGVWVWVYGPDYYYDDYAYGGDCYWLRQQAYATGSPYWWSRYNACIGYY